MEGDIINNEDSEVINGADEMREMLKIRDEQYGAKYYYKLSKLTNNNGTYTATVDFYSPVYITEEKYNNMVNDGKIELNGASYAFSRIDSEFNIGYGVIMSNDGQTYCIEKQGDKYAFYREIGGVWRTIDTNENSFEITLKEEFVIKQFPTGGSYTLKEYANNLTETFINRNMITFEYSEQNGELYMQRDAR